MNFAATSRDDVVAAVRVEYPAVHQVNLVFDTCRIAVRTNSAPLCQNLSHYFRPFLGSDGSFDILITAHEAPTPQFAETFEVKQPDPGKKKIKEEYLDIDQGRIVRKRLTGMHFIFGGTENVAVGPCLANANQVINFVNNRFISWKLEQGCLLGHAAGVSKNGHGLALAGFSGMGKSTLALYLMSRGLTFVSNDRIMVEQNGAGLVMSGVAKLPRINPGTALNNPDLDKVIPEDDRARFTGLTTDELWNLEHKYDVYIDEAYGEDRFELSAPMCGLVILNWQRIDAPMSFAEVDINARLDLLPAFMKSTGLFYLPEGDLGEDPATAEYQRILSRCKVFEISGGVDFAQAAEACLKFLAA